MSNEEKKESQMNDEKRAFIREQIAPKRRDAVRRFFGSVWKTSILAVLFGLIGSLVFSAMSPYFDRFFKKDKKNAVVLVEPTPSQTPQPSKEPTPSPEPEEKPEEIDDKKIAEVIDAESFSKLYDMLYGIADKFNRSVVKVSGVQKGVDWFDNPAESEDAANGVIIADTEEKVYILTSYDKITGVNRIQVTFENQEVVDAVLEGKDKDTNIAVVSIEYEAVSKEVKKNMETAVLGDSYYAKIGTPVLALGNPNGYLYSMDFGIISKDEIERHITDASVELFTTNMMHTEEGNGVIVDLSGNIMGIITHRFDDAVKSNSCAAIGINSLKSIIEKLINGEEIPYFGVIASNIPEKHKKSLGVERGIYVTEVLNSSPALKAGIQAGDIITDFGDTEITSIANFTGALSMLSPKDEIEVSLVRTSQLENKEKTVKVTIAARR